MVKVVWRCGYGYGYGEGGSGNYYYGLRPILWLQSQVESTIYAEVIDDEVVMKE
jgi:hypothetical protein